MYTSKLKLILHWLLFIIGFYLLWSLAYLVLVKFALSQINRLTYAKESVWSQITASDVFWYAMFIFGLSIVIFGIRKLIQYSPNRKIAALIYGILIIVSVGILLDKLLETNKVIDILPHLVINLAFLIPIIITFFNKNTTKIQEEEIE